MLGQIDLNRNIINFGGPSALNQPSAAAVDDQGHLYVVDQGNNRVLGFADAASFVNGAPAQLVIGEPDFYSASAGYPNVSASTLNGPQAVATDQSGNLYVSDFLDDRVLEYKAPFQSGYTAGQPANMVFGQNASFTTPEHICQNQAAPTPDNLCGPTGVAVDKEGNLFVTDSGNNRVLVYLDPTAVGGGTPATPGSPGDTTADVVFGQNNDFFQFNPCTTTPGIPGPPTASNLCIAYGSPGGIAVDRKGNVFIADLWNFRVLEYNTPLNANSGESGAGDTIADLVIGQAGFTKKVACGYRRTDRVLCFPSGVAVDDSGNVYVLDAGKNRVLEYNAPLDRTSGERGAGDTVPDLVIGPGPGFPKGICFPGQLSASGLCLYLGFSLPAVDSAGNIYLPDWGNNRLLEYDTPRASGTKPARELGQADFSHNSPNFVTAKSLMYPFAVAVDSNGHVYVADYNRVVGWRNAIGFTNGQAADLVIGQSDFYSTTCYAGKRATASTLCGPHGIAVDSGGNLFVADSVNDRVMAFANPFAACAGEFPCVGGAAIKIFGRPPRHFSYGYFRCDKPSAVTLCNPSAVWADSADNLWVADTGFSRVLLFRQPLVQVGRTPRKPGSAGDTIADLVIGQGMTGRRFNTAFCDNGHPSSLTPSTDTICVPTGVAVDNAGNVYVSDSANGRVLEYDNPLATSGGTPGAPGHAGDVTADLAFDPGGSFTTANCGATADTLCAPAQLATDIEGDLYVADRAGNRVVEYLNPVASSGGMPGTPGHAGDTTADVVFGQNGDLTQGFCNGNSDSRIVNATTLCGPEGVAVDSAGNVYIADTMNNRVLAFENASP